MIKHFILLLRNIHKKEALMKRIPLLMIFLIFGFASLLCARIPLDAVDEYRYYAIKPLIKQYQRPITFLHIWPDKSHVSLAIAQKYDCSTIILDPQATSFLPACSSYDNIVLLNSDLSVKELRSLGECEHIDVTLVRNIAEIFPNEWKKAVDQTLTMGDYTILETPPINSKLYRPVVEYFKKKGGERIGLPASEITRHVGELYQFATMKKYLIKRRWNYKNAWHLGEYTIESSFATKNFIKKKTKPKGYSVTTWHPGINLYTFKHLNGIYPTHEKIRAMLYPLASLQHNDLRIFNLIIQGNKLVPIDSNENERHADPQVLLPGIVAQFRNRKMRLIQEFECPNAETYDDEMQNEQQDFDIP